MNKYLAIIDPYMKSPALGGFERISKLTNLKCRYYQPSRLSLNRLHLEENVGFIVLGSASHVFEKLDWQIELSNFLVKELHKKKPVLGICFGHQLLAHAFGAKVDFYNPKQTKLCGTRQITLTEDLFELKKDSTFSFPVTHRQIVVEIPACLQTIGSGSNPELKHDIIQHRELPFIGIQAHVEACDEFAKNEAQINESIQMKKAQQDGEIFIQNFLNQFNLSGK